MRVQENENVVRKKVILSEAKKRRIKVELGGRGRRREKEREREREGERDADKQTGRQTAARRDKGLTSTHNGLVKRDREMERI